jgi:hypothetical protein
MATRSATVVRELPDSHVSIESDEGVEAPAYRRLGVPMLVVAGKCQDCPFLAVPRWGAQLLESITQNHYGLTPLELEVLEKDGGWNPLIRACTLASQSGAAELVEAAGAAGRLGRWDGLREYLRSLK